MSTALQIVQIIFYIAGIVFIVSFMNIGIWSFVIFNKTFKALRIKNYLLDNLNKNITKLSSKSNVSNEINDLNNSLDFIDSLNIDDSLDNHISCHDEYND